VTALAEIREEITNDPANAWARELNYAPVYSAAPAARVVVVGQAPGRRAQESGVPWHDLSGLKLRQWLGVTDGEFYDPGLFAILPMDFYFPGKGVHGDLPPRRDFAAKWHPRILAELPCVALTVLVGAYAQKHYLGARRKANLTATVRAYQEYLPSSLPLVHPSPLTIGWQRRNPWFEADVIPALRQAVRAVLEGPPSTGARTQQRASGFADSDA
jgi:uracil-DNA glycosylase